MTLKQRNSLRKERKAIENRQEYLREKLRRLREYYDMDSANYEKALEAGNDTACSMLENSMKHLSDMIDKAEAEYDGNFDRISTMSQVQKCDNEKHNNTAGTILAWGTGLATTILAGIALGDAYRTDQEGTLVNKRTFDEYRRLNPLNMLTTFFRRR